MCLWASANIPYSIASANFTELALLIYFRDTLLATANLFSLPITM